MGRHEAISTICLITGVDSLLTLIRFVEVLCFDEGRLESRQAAMEFCGSADGLSDIGQAWN